MLGFNCLGKKEIADNKLSVSCGTTRMWVGARFNQLREKRCAGKVLIPAAQKSRVLFIHLRLGDSTTLSWRWNLGIEWLIHIAHAKPGPFTFTLAGAHEWIDIFKQVEFWGHSHHLLTIGSTVAILGILSLSVYPAWETGGSHRYRHRSPEQPSLPMLIVRSLPIFIKGFVPWTSNLASKELL